MFAVVSVDYRNRDEGHARSARTSPFRLESLLLASVIALILQLTWPGIVTWWNRPLAGRQVPQSVQFGDRLCQFQLYLPREYSTHNAWPLVIYLHGSGLRGNDLDLVSSEGPPLIASTDGDLPFVLVSPQCSESRSWEPEIIRAITTDVTTNYHIDRARIYLTGYSMGGYGTWRTAGEYPDQFAAIAPLCGRGNVKQADRLVNMPTWAFHGEADDVVPLSGSKEMVESINQAGGNAKLTVIPGAGHGICDMVYQDWNN